MSRLSRALLQRAVGNSFLSSRRRDVGSERFFFFTGEGIYARASAERAFLRNSRFRFMDEGYIYVGGEELLMRGWC